MSDNPRLISDLSKIGFTKYESMAYLTLLRSNPVSAYELSKLSGVPLPKIYETVNRLTQKGAAIAIEGEPTKWIPVDPKEIISMFSSDLNACLNNLSRELPNLVTQGFVERPFNVVGKEAVAAMMAVTIDEAEKTLHLSVWPEMSEFTVEPLKRAAERGVQVSAIEMGSKSLQIGQTYLHGITEQIRKDRGRAVIVVADDSKAAVAIHPSNGADWQGMWTKNPAIVSIFKEYIKHDIYIWKIGRRFNPVIQTAFGDQLELLRNVTADLDSLGPWTELVNSCVERWKGMGLINSDQPCYKEPAPGPARYARILWKEISLPFSLAWFANEPGASSKPHVHEESSETYFGISGKGLIRVGSREFEVGPGAVHVVPAGVEHSAISRGAWEYLVMHSPGIDWSPVENTWTVTKDQQRPQDS